MSERKVIIDFSSPMFEMSLDEVGLEFGDKSDSELTAKDVADIIAAEYNSFEEFISDWMLDSATINIQLEGFAPGDHYTHAEVEL